jgi:putative membrane protein
MNPSSPIRTSLTGYVRTLLTVLRDRRRTPLEWFYLALWVIYLAGYPIAVTGVAFDVRPGFSMAWAGSYLLLVQGTLAALWLLLTQGFRKGGLLALTIVLIGLLGETLGVTSAFPFGPYSYAPILVPQWPGSVPLPVTFAWLLITATSVAWALRLTPRAHGGKAHLPQRIAIATILGLILDLVLEPVAVHIEGYWIWHAAGSYYGIPTQNFVGWASLCALLSSIVLSAVSAPSPRVEGTTVFPGGRSVAFPDLQASARWLYVLTLAMFAFIDLTHGLWLASAIGSSALLCLAVLSRATYDIQ